MKRILLSLAVLSGLVAAPPALAQEDMTFANWFYEGELRDAFEKYRISFEEAHPEVGTPPGGRAGRARPPGGLGGATGSCS